MKMKKMLSSHNGPSLSLAFALLLGLCMALANPVAAQSDDSDVPAPDAADDDGTVEVDPGSMPEVRDDSSDEYICLTHRRHLWVYRKSTHTITYYTVPEISDRPRPIEESRPFVIDEREFPIDTLRLQVSERNLTNYLWLLNPVTGKARVLNARRDGTIVSSSLLDLAIQGPTAPAGGIDYQYHTFRRSLWVFQRSSLTICFYTFPEAGTDSEIQRSRIYNIDPIHFPLSQIQLQVSQRNLSSYLWLLNPVTGKARILKARRDGIIEESEFLDTEKK